MKVICKDKTIDLNHFETVAYRESLFGSEEGYPVEAIRKEARHGFFGGIETIKEEIIRFTDEETAKNFLEDITKHWIDGDDRFYVNVWLEELRNRHQNENKEVAL